MPLQVAFLRAINVAGRSTVAMAKLRELFESLGFTEVQSLLQSGNIVFQSERLKGTALEELLEAETTKRLKLSPDYLVRSGAELQAVIKQNPFPGEAESDPGHLVVLFLKQAAEAKAVRNLQAAIQGPEIVRAKGKQLYAVYPAGIGRSKLTNALIEKHLVTRCTGRNWNTILKLGALIEG